MHKVINPNILYFGTPVVLISSLNEDKSTNLAPMSSAWWLGKSCMLGMSRRSKTVQNLINNRECVLNLPSSYLVESVNKLALLTGKNPVPDYKVDMGYRYEPDKFSIASFTSMSSDLVKPRRVAQCPVQLEGTVERIHDFGDPDSHLASIEVKILRVHIEEELIVPGTDNYIDPSRWKPLIMSFCEFFGLEEKLIPSTLANAYAPKIPAL